MENKLNGSKRINPTEVDGAIDEALTRVEQADELSQDDLDKANGGTIPPTSGFIDAE